MTFQDLGLCPPILSALKDLGYQKPSPIQEKAIPPALTGRDVLGCAQTGTGKTCAFAAPILQRLMGFNGPYNAIAGSILQNASHTTEKPLAGSGTPNNAIAASILQNAARTTEKPRHYIRALILTPTRELALQIQESFEAYGKNLPLRSAVIFGGVGQQPQVDKLRAGVDILVATPGRLQDLHDQGFIHVEKLEIFVLDEADRMLDMGFIHDVKKILTWLPQKKQTLFFSATMPPEVQGLVDSLLVDPVKVAVDPVSSTVEVIDQKLYYVDRGNKSRLLAALIKGQNVKNALVFTRTKHGANKVAGDLAKAGIPSAAIHGNKSQTARQQALADFKAGKVKALVATDIAARGIDIEELSHVFNYNLPDVPETYVHRIGRTGRAGHEGTAISFCEFGEKELLTPIQRLLKRPIPVVEDHPYPMQNFEAPKRDKHGKIVNADDAEARQAARERKQQRQAAKKEWQTGSAGTALQSGPTRREAPKPAQKQQSKAQTPAAGKRASAGYKPSRTLDEALTAMSPKRGRREGKPVQKEPDRPAAARDAAFEAWLAEERAIQAKQEHYRDPLAGEAIMDATARLLAPKGEPRPTASSPRPARREDAPTRDRPARSSERKKPSRPAGQSRQESKASKPAPQSQKREGSKPARKKDPRRNDRGRGRGPMEVTLRLGSQKDSTEQQGSLMRPYYFNPNED